ncbi:MAG TPA: hypothetical protein VKS21_02425 [Spirochaetota bacterium]|nr:hypothetical protein [Spirochaetota bacterium]
MFGLGIWEITIIIILIVIFIKPADLPAFLYRIGKLYGQFSSYYNKLRFQIDKTRRSLEQEINLHSKEADKDAFTAAPGKKKVKTSQTAAEDKHRKTAPYGQNAVNNDKITKNKAKKGGKQNGRDKTHY